MKHLVTSSAVVEITSPAPNDGMFELENLGPNSVWLGNDDDVTVANGFELGMGTAITVGTGVMYAICAPGETADIRTLGNDRSMRTA